MAQYDVHPGIGNADFVLDVQSNLLDVVNTRVVVPLILEEKAPFQADRLNPIFDINGKSYVMATQSLASVSVSVLKTPVVNLSARGNEITNALDMVFHGY